MFLSVARLGVSDNVRMSFVGVRERAERFAPQLHQLIGQLLGVYKINVAQLQYRVKDLDSIDRKWEIHAYSRPDQLTDLIGVRIVTFYEDEVLAVSEMIRREFLIDSTNSGNKWVDRLPEEFGYRSEHLVASLGSPRSEQAEWRPFNDLKFEFQVRSELQHAWASVSHKLDYKAPSSVPNEIRRRLFRLSALLELADQEFVLIRNEIRKVVDEFRNDIGNGRLDIPLNQISLAEFLAAKVDLGHWEQVGEKAGMAVSSDRMRSRPDPSGVEVERLLRILRAIGITRVIEVDKLIESLKGDSIKFLKDFVAAVKNEGQTFYAVGTDILTVLVSMTRSRQLPPGFSWGHGFRQAKVEEVLRELCRLE